MKKIIGILLVFVTGYGYAQVPEDAIRYSWYPQKGTARNMAIGGVMGSLGGDITAGYVNPAGLGFYKTNEVVLSPGFFLNRNTSNFRQAETLVNKNAFAFGPSGVIFALPSSGNQQKNNTISLAVSQTASFNNTYRFKALNNYSSFSEQFAEELAKSGIPIEEYLYSNSFAPYTVAPAWFAYLIDTVSVGGIPQVRGAAENILDSGQALEQEMIKKTSGGIYELSFSFAENSNKKWLWGAGIGIPIVYYKSNTTFIEKDTSSNRFNGFSSSDYNDNFQTSGIGVNIKIGAIYRPKDYIRLGVAIHTPSFMTLKDKRTVTIQTELEDSLGNVEPANVGSSLSFTEDQPGQPAYFQSSPWRAIVSASYVFREVADVTKQRGFISADIEYVNHRGSRFSSNNEEPAPDETAYYKSLNKVVKQEYKGNVNFKIGGEVKFHTIMTRIGFAYYGSPYKDKSLKANQLLLSGGLGYRNKGFFVDLTYVHNVIKDVSFPYRLQDRANTFATLKNQQGNVMATIGFKF